MCLQLFDLDITTLFAWPFVSSAGFVLFARKIDNSETTLRYGNLRILQVQLEWRKFNQMKCMKPILLKFLLAALVCLTFVKIVYLHFNYNFSIGRKFKWKQYTVLLNSMAQYFAPLSEFWFKKNTNEGL